MAPAQERTRFKELAERFDQYRKKPFPNPGPDPDIQDLHGELAAYDAELAGSISRILRGEKLRFGRFGRGRDLARRIRELRQEKPEASALLDGYLEIYEQLQEMIDLAEGISS